MSVHGFSFAVGFVAAVSSVGGCSSPSAGPDAAVVHDAVVLADVPPIEEDIFPQHDGGPPDVGVVLPACAADPAPLTVVAAGRQLVVASSGAPLVDPVGLTFGADGALYVGNSHSWLSPGNLRGEILRRHTDGTFETYVDDPRLVGPGWIAFGPGGATDGPGIGYLGTEDADEALARATDQLLVVDGTTVTDGPDASEVGRLEIGPGGAFGTALYFTGRADPATVMPDPARLLRWTPGGTATPEVVAITNGTTPVGAVAAFAFAHGGALGTDLYVASVLDPGFTLDATVALWRVDSTFAATSILADVVIADLVASPSPTGTWGDALYAFAVDAAGAGRVVRITAAGEVTDLATGFGRFGALAFGPDDALWISDTAGHAILRMTACAD